MVLAIRYATTTQNARSISPRLEAIAGNAVATMVWSATARNIGSMMGGKIAKNPGCAGDAAEAASEAAASFGSAPPCGAAACISRAGRWKESFIVLLAE